MALTAKQQRFVDEYFARGFNATQAAIAAGYSEKTAASTGSENLRKPEVRAAVDAQFEKLANDAALMKTLLVRELVAILSTSLAGVVEWDDDTMRLVPSDELTVEQAASLKEVTITLSEFEMEHATRRTRRSKVGQHDKLRAAELLAKLHGLSRDRIDVSATVGITLERLLELAAEAGPGDTAPA